MPLLVALLVVFIVALLIYWAGHRIGDAFGAPAQIMVIFDVILVVVVVLWLLGAVGWVRVPLGR
jgi:hypothetical protein